jgi:hypothetical protein
MEKSKPRSLPTSDPRGSSILEATEVDAHHELAPPQIRPPVPNGEDLANQFLLIVNESTVAWSNRSAEEVQLVLVLEQPRAKPVRRSVAFDDG